MEWSDIKTLSYQKYPPRYRLTPQQSTQDQSVGSALLDRCLSITKPRADDCKVSWADVDSFTLHNYYTCDVEKIVIDGQSFLWHLQSKDEATQTQWLQLANVVNVSSHAHTIKDLIHFQKLSTLLAAPMRALETKSNKLKNSTLVDTSLPSAKFSKLAILDYFKDLSHPEQSNSHIALNSTLFNVNTLSIQKIDNTNGTFSYNVNLDFLSDEIREVLEIIESIAIYKWPSTPETLFFYHLKPGTKFNEQQIAWLTGTLNRTQYSQLLQKFPDVFTRCEQSCLDFTLFNSDVMRHTLIQLIHLANFAKPIESFTQNLTSILPYRNTLGFTDGIQLMLDDKAHRLAYANSNQSIAKLIQTYSSLARRLNIRFIINNTMRKQILNIGHRNKQILHNHPAYVTHLVTNGDGKKFVVGAGQANLNVSHFPLADVILYASSNDRHKSLLDFRPLVRQIKQDFNATLSILLSKQDNDIILNRRLTVSGDETSQQSLSVISVRLKDARIDRWYRNLLIIPNVAKTQLTIHGLNLQLIPFHLQLKVNNGSTDFISVNKLEKNSAIFIPRAIDHYRFFYHQDDLVLTNAFTPNLEINQLCNIVLQGFQQESEKAMTLSLEFVNKKILLSEQRDQIVNATRSWNDTLYQHKNNLFLKAYQLGSLPEFHSLEKIVTNPLFFIL